MRKKILLVFTFIVFLLSFKPNSVFAVTINISNSPPTILTDPFTLTASVSGALAGTNYLRIDLFKDGTTDYFGETYNGTDWYNGADYEQYLPITIVSGTPWIGYIQGKLNNLVENGNYKLRIRRYTTSGSQSSSDSLDVNINLPTPTLTPTPLLTPISPITLSPTPTTIEPTPIPISDPISYNNIYLSETMVYPETGGNEWVEFYNNNDYEVNLANWYLDDIENAGASPKLFSLQIKPKSYAVFDLTSSMFNNDSDNVRLLDFNKNIKDSFEYHITSKGKTLGKNIYDSDNICIQEPSKGTANNNCLVSPAPTTEPEDTPKPTKEEKPTIIKSASKSENEKNALVQQSAESYEENHIPIEISQSDEDNNPESIQLEKNPQVLGESNHQESPKKPILKSLSFASSSFSLLTIVSIIFKVIKTLS